MTEEYAKQISHWTYEGEYSIYSFQPDEETLAEPLDGSYFACTLGQELVGYFCFGASATIPTVPGSVSLPQGDFLDFGLGMRPDLCGQGRERVYAGRAFVWKAEISCRVLPACGGGLEQTGTASLSEDGLCDCL